MFRVELICTDEDCAERIEAYGTLEEIEALACECGCTLTIVVIAERVEERPPASVTALPELRTPAARAA